MRLRASVPAAGHRAGRRRAGEAGAGGAGGDRRRRRDPLPALQPGGVRRHDPGRARDPRGDRRGRACPWSGLSPIVGDAPVRGMADKVLAAVGVESTAAAVAEHYGSGLLDGWLVDTVDAGAVERVEDGGHPLPCRAADDDGRRGVGADGARGARAGRGGAGRLSGELSGEGAAAAARCGTGSGPCAGCPRCSAGDDLAKLIAAAEPGLRRRGRAARHLEDRVQGRGPRRRGGGPGGRDRRRDRAGRRPARAAADRGEPAGAGDGRGRRRRLQHARRDGAVAARGPRRVRACGPGRAAGRAGRRRRGRRHRHLRATLARRGSPTWRSARRACACSTICAAARTRTAIRSPRRSWRSPTSWPPPGIWSRARLSGLPVAVVRGLPQCGGRGRQREGGGPGAGARRPRRHVPARYVGGRTGGGDPAAHGAGLHRTSPSTPGRYGGRSPPR